MYDTTDEGALFSIFFPVRGEPHILITPRRFLRTDQEEIELNVFWAKEIV